MHTHTHACIAHTHNTTPQRSPVSVTAQWLSQLQMQMQHCTACMLGMHRAVLTPQAHTRTCMPAWATPAHRGFVWTPGDVNYGRCLGYTTPPLVCSLITPGQVNFKAQYVAVEQVLFRFCEFFAKEVRGRPILFCKGTLRAPMWRHIAPNTCGSGLGPTMPGKYKTPQEVIIISRSLRQSTAFSARIPNHFGTQRYPESK